MSGVPAKLVVDLLVELGHIAPRCDECNSLIIGGPGRCGRCEDTPETRAIQAALLAWDRRTSCAA